MTILTSAPAATTHTELPARRGLMHDTWVIARRGLIHMKRQPEALSDATIQPIMFVLLFAYVFGGAISVPGGGSYRSVPDGRHLRPDDRVFRLRCGHGHRP